jgi:hypothetical protein
MVSKTITLPYHFSSQSTFDVGRSMFSFVLHNEPNQALWRKDADGMCFQEGI